MAKVYPSYRVIAFLILSVRFAAGTAATVHVDSSGTLPEKTGALASLADVPWKSLQPGDEVVVHPGEYSDVVVIDGHGAPGKPVYVHAEKGSAPVIENSIVLEGASHVVLEGLTVRNAKHSGFIIRRGAEDITVKASRVEQSGLGVWIGDGAKGQHRILDNTFNNNETHGVAVDFVSAAPGKETIISGNRIFRNGMHGIELSGNYYIIEKNTVFENGQALSGTSNIHLYSDGPTRDVARHNIIRYNVAYGEKEDSGQDGNGIQLDQWCDDNEVYFNVAFRNDGAGIAIFDAARNKIYNNTLFDNMLDPGKSHAYRGELVMASDFTKNVNHSSHNLIVNNLIVATRPENVAIYVDRLSSGNPHEIGGNALYHRAPAANLFFWRDGPGREIAQWNKLKGGDPDLMVDPKFSDPTRPADNGLRLSRNSTLTGAGKAITRGVTADLTGKPFDKPPVGAYVAE